MKTLRVLLLLWLASVGAGAFAQSAPYSPLTWSGVISGSKSPSQFCADAASVANDYLVAKVWLGFPSQFVCHDAYDAFVLVSGYTIFTTTPSCPSGYHVDLPLQLCALNTVESGGTGGPDIPLTSAEIASIWTVGFGLVVACFLIGRAVGAVLEFIRKG